jgi:ribosome-binding protein aMBF1 (putative translation factor)
VISGSQIRAARGLVRWSAEKLAQKSKLGVATVRRAEAVDGEPPITIANAEAVRAALESAGVIFVEGGGDGPGVRLRKAAR